jgi:hypothetical protein
MEKDHEVSERSQMMNRQLESARSLLRFIPCYKHVLIAYNVSGIGDARIVET